MTSTNNSIEEAKRELKEKLAAIEHERWGDWQKWMHGLMLLDKEWARIERHWFDRWQRQIHTSYSNLSDSEKASDMEQVNRYWPLIEEYINKALTAAKKDKLTKGDV